MATTFKVPLALLAAITAIATILLPSISTAGGYEYPGQATTALGRGDAFTAKADDLSAMHYNPAGLAKNSGPFKVLYNHTLTMLDYEFQRAPASVYIQNGISYEEQTVEFDSVSQDDAIFPLGVMFGVSSNFGVDGLAVALGMFGPNAYGTSSFPLVDQENPSNLYEPSNPAKYSFVDKEIVMIYYTLSVAYNFKDKVGVGVSLQWLDTPLFKYSMMVDGYTDKTIYPVNSPFDILTRLDVTDRFTPSAIVGAWYKPVDWLELAISARPFPTHIEADGTLDLELVGVSISNIDEWSMDDNSASLSLSFPAWIRGAIRYIHHGEGGKELFDVELDFVYEMWSVVDQFKIDMNSTIDIPELAITSTLTEVIIPKKFDDTWSVRLGGDVNVIPDLLTLRVGGLYESAAVPKAYTNLEFTAMSRVGISAGATIDIIDGLKLTVAYQHLFQPKREVSTDESKVYQQRPAQLCQAPYDDQYNCDTNYFDENGQGIPGAVVGAGTYTSSYDMFSFGLSYDY